MVPSTSPGDRLTAAATIDVAAIQGFNNLTFAPASGGAIKAVAAGDTLVVNGTLTLTEGNFGTGTLAARGDVNQLSTFDGGTGLLLIDGAGAQTFTGTATSTVGALPALNINKPSGT